MIDYRRMRAKLVVSGVAALAIAAIVAWLATRERSPRADERAGSAGSTIGPEAAPTTGNAPSLAGAAPHARATTGVPSKPGADEAGKLREVPKRYHLVTRANLAAVDMRGEDSQLFVPERGEPKPTRAVTGRVVDAADRPVAGAIVLAAERFSIWAGSLTGEAGTTTASDGSFSLPDAPTNAKLALAFNTSGWSELAPIGDAPLLLHLGGRGALHGRATYNGHTESFQVHVAAVPAKQFDVMYVSDPDGTFTIASLPPGPYKLSVGLYQDIAGGASRMTEREIQIEAGKTTEVEIAQTSGAMVVLTARGGDAPAFYEYWLFPGDAPASAEAARARAKAEHTRGYLVGGKDLTVPVQIHDVAAGGYHACAHTDKNAYGCTSVTVLDGDNVRELEIVVR
jgi:hypothetical protein